METGLNILADAVCAQENNFTDWLLSIHSEHKMKLNTFISYRIQI